MHVERSEEGMVPAVHLWQIAEPAAETYPEAQAVQLEATPAE